MRRTTTTSAAATIAALTVALGGCASMTTDSLEAKGYHALNGEELRALHEGGTSARWNIYGGPSGTAMYRKDGSAAVVASGETLSGTWRIKDDQFCSSYRRLRGGTERCYTMYGNGGSTYEMFYGGSHYATTKY